MRLTKLIATRGVASRREAERMVRAGEVTVNGEVADHPGTDVDADRDHVKVRGRLLPPARPPVVLAVHKPAGVMTTRDDPEDRRTVFDLLEGTRYHAVVEPVGRLDYGSEGLLLLTNDGELAHRLTHPRYHVSKTYLVKITGVLDERKLRLLRDGVPLDDGRTMPALVQVQEARERNSWLRITVREGRNRVVRRMVDFVGHRVLRLRRVAIGRLELGDLPRGRFRVLSGTEIQALRDLADGEGKRWFEAALERQRRDRRRRRGGGAAGRSGSRQGGNERGGRRGRSRGRARGRRRGSR